MKQALLAALVMGGLAAEVHAQTTRKPIAIGFGLASSVGVGTDGSSPVGSWAASIRYDVRPRMSLEGEFSYVSDSDDSTTGPGRFTVVTNNVARGDGSYASQTLHTSDSTWSGMFSVLWHTPGRVSFFGGPGVGLGATNSEYRLSYSGCTAPDPRYCQGYSSPREGSGLMLQGMAGVNARITRNLEAFTSFTARSGYLYSPGAVRVMAGARFVF